MSVVVTCLVALASACGSAGGAIDVDLLKDEPSVLPARGYIIAPGDLLSIQVFNPVDRDDRISGRMRVRSDGRISLTFLNDIEAANKTPVQFAADIEAGLKSVIVKPQVTVVVEESSPLSVSVLGEVMKPGLQTLERDAGVARALAAAGGLSVFAHKDRIFVVRSNPQPIRIRFRYEALTRNVGRAPTFRLLPGDVVLVE